MTQPVTAVYDANILYPAPLRDLFIRLAQTGLVRAKWTERIHDEWFHSALIDHPRLSRERLNRTRALMNEAIRDCLICGYEDLIPSLALPDPNDRHVLAAAIRCRADVIVTCNLVDFPLQALKPFDLVAQHPDDFLVDLFELAPGSVCTAVKNSDKACASHPKHRKKCLKPWQTKVWARPSPSSGHSRISFKKATSQITWVTGCW